MYTFPFISLLSFSISICSYSAQVKEWNAKAEEITGFSLEEAATRDKSQGEPLV